jgi:hypothetical protein
VEESSVNDASDLVMKLRRRQNTQEQMWSVINSFLMWKLCVRATIARPLPLHVSPGISVGCGLWLRAWSAWPDSQALAVGSQAILRAAFSADGLVSGDARHGHAGARPLSVLSGSRTVAIHGLCGDWTTDSQRHVFVRLIGHRCSPTAGGCRWLRPVLLWALSSRILSPH